MANRLVFIEGLDSIIRAAREAGSLDSDLAVIASQAVNTAATRGRTSAQSQAIREIAFPSGYLNPGAGRLTVAKRANPANPEAFIRGRGRPVSLARFAVSTSRAQAGVLVQVARGKTQRLERAFLINLKSGTSDTKNNLGLAIRLPAGQRPREAYRPKKIAPGLFLLYGPSIDQMLRVIADNGLSEDIARNLQEEFLRLKEVRGI